jgi:hypothetical protein
MRKLELRYVTWPKYSQSVQCQDTRHISSIKYNMDLSPEAFGSAGEIERIIHEGLSYYRNSRLDW